MAPRDYSLVAAVAGQISLDEFPLPHHVGVKPRIHFLEPPFTLESRLGFLFSADLYFLGSRLGSSLFLVGGFILLGFNSLFLGFGGFLCVHFRPVGENLGGTIGAFW